jgi:hypothetical protein
VEDLPSIVLNLVDVYLRGQKKDFAADLQLCLTALPIILSCVTSGRKSSLPVKIRELQATKAECEERMKEAGGRRPSIVNGFVLFGVDADGKSSSSSLSSKNSSSRVQPVFDGGEEDIARKSASTEVMIGSEQQRQQQEKDDDDDDGDGDDDHMNGSKSFMKNDDSREAENTDENVAVIKKLSRKQEILMRELGEERKEKEMLKAELEEERKEKEMLKAELEEMKKTR